MGFDMTKTAVATAKPAVAAPRTPYDATFFSSLSPGSLRSARAIVPVVMDLIHPQSVVDVGCGTGAWLSVFDELGVKDYLGIDGAYVDRSQLLIAPSKFIMKDLARDELPPQRYDLACCLEVGEHLPERRSRALARMLTRLAPVLLFSAALPEQGGIHHINEQWPGFWHALFAECGYHRVDAIRPKIWRQPDIDPWYQQNIYLYVDSALLSRNPVLARERELTEAFPFEFVHENVIRGVAYRYTFRGALAALPALVRKAIERKWNWFFKNS
jgi:SAM-dependent methyltransferase